MESKCSLLPKADWLVGQAAVIRGCAYSDLLIYNVGYTWQHLTSQQHREMFCRRFCKGRKAHGNLSPGAAGAELCWQKEPGTTGEVRSCTAACPALKHSCSSTCSSRAPAAAAPSPCHSTLRQARGLLLLSVIHFKCSPADPGSALSFPHLSSALSPFFGVQPHSCSEHLTAIEWDTVGATVPLTLPVCHPLPSSSLNFFIKVQLSVQQSPETTPPTGKPHHAPAPQCSTEIFLWRKQKYSSETSALTSGREVLCTAAKNKFRKPN